MTTPNNVLQAVQTYQRSELAFLLNMCPVLSTSNTRFKNFNDFTANLGDTITFDKPVRARAVSGLQIVEQAVQQRVQSLTCDQSANYAINFTDQQFIFNDIPGYMRQFGMSAVTELGSQIESNVSENALTGTYRYYGTPTSPITSFGELSQMYADFIDFGAPNGRLKVYLPVTAVPPIANSGLNQFAPDRNNKMVQSWQIASYSNMDFYSSNLLPTHIAGNLAEAGTTLTLVSTNDPTGLAVTQLTFSGAGGADVNAIKKNDLFTFQDGVSGKPNLRYLTFTGHKLSQQPVQFRATADAASSGGNVTISVSPVLVSQQTQNQNLNVALQAGMQIKGVPSHRAGLVVSGDALFVAVPKLPLTTPFPSSNDSDPQTGVSLRHYYGTQFGQASSTYVHDLLWGSTLVEEYAMRLIFPL